MTVPTLESTADFVTNGVTTNFPFFFKFFSDSDLVVTYVDPLGISTVLVLGIDYTVSGAGSDNGGSVLTNSTLAGPGQLVVVRDMEALQDTSFRNQGKFLAETHEDAFDKLTMLIQQGLSVFQRALRVQEYDPIPQRIPSVAQRRGKLLSFDTAGNPITAAMPSESAADLAARLADAFSAINGAGMSGFSYAIPYPANTLGGAIRGQRNIRMFGSIADNGATNDIATLVAAGASGPGIIDARGLKNCLVTGNIPIGAGQTWLLTGSKFVTANTALDLFSIITKDDVSLVGPFSVAGPGGATFVGGAAIRIEDSTKWRIIDPTITGIAGFGIHVTPGASTSLRSNHGVITNPRIHGCNIGMKDLAGTGAEYYTVTNPHITGCYEAGAAWAAGNVVVMGGHIVDNLKTGLFLNAGSNHAHGIIFGVNINHNVVYNLEAHEVLNGQSIIGCHFYANNASGAGAIFLDRCKGIDINGGVLDCQIYNYADANSGMNMIRNMYCPGDYGRVVLNPGTNDGLYQLWITECYGAGAVNQATGVSINDPAIVDVQVKRLPGSAQSVGTGTQLTFTTEDYDRRLAFSPAGVFTVPPGQAGRYEIKGHLVFSGTSLTAANSYVEIKRGANFLSLFPTVPYSTTKLGVELSWPVDLIAGDTITIVATISGSSQAFGDNTYGSYLSIRRVG